jgi:hypothetical protein
MKICNRPKNLNVMTTARLVRELKLAFCGVYVPGLEGQWTGPVVGLCQHGEVRSVYITIDLSGCQHVSYCSAHSY